MTVPVEYDYDSAMDTRRQNYNDQLPSVEEQCNLNVGDVIKVSNVYGKKKDDDDSGTMSIIGKYYPEEGSGITILPKRGTEIQGNHGEIWNVSIVKILERCIIGEWLECIGEWKQKRQPKPRMDYSDEDTGYNRNRGKKNFNNKKRNKNW